MTQILVLNSVMEDTFVCGLCKTVLNSLTSFVDHKNSDCFTSDPNFGIESFETVSLLKTILEAPEQSTAAIESDYHTSKTIENISTDVSNECKYKCDICNKAFKKYNNLVQHKKNHEEKTCQCLICGRCFNQNSHLQRHIMSHKVWPDGLTKTTARSKDVELLSYTCPYCHLILSNYSKFRVHLKNHSSLKKFKCVQGECMRFFDDMKSLLDHVLISHDYCLYPCYMCNMTFYDLKSIALHYQNHSDSKNKACLSAQFKCSHCDAVFLKPETLSLHMVTESHRKTCIHCDKTFASDKRLRLHLQVHRKLKPFQCNICNSGFKLKKYLNAHMSRHRDIFYACNICDNKYKRRDLLQRHMKSHQPKKTLKCPFSDSLNCKMEFFRNDKLKSHVKSHTKHMTVASNTVIPTDTSTVEICIVPLDMNA